MRVVDRPERRLLARRAERELVQVGLAEDDGARLAESLDDGRVANGQMPLPHVGRGGRQLAGDVDEILDRDRHPVQGAAIDSATAFLVHGPRRGARGDGLGVDERVGTGAVFGEGGKACFEAVACGERQWWK